ncbi:MAG: hypothetical protein ACO3E0_07530 [Candidatus Kapaibacteriota bacterium]
MNTPHQFSPEEALDAYLDGELPVTSEQDLFDELQSSTELRTVLRDTLSIRRAVQSDSMIPPTGGEAALLSAIGLVTAPAAAAVVHGTGAASSWFGSNLTPLLTAAGGLVAGFFLALSLKSGASGEPPTATTSSASVVAPGPAPALPVGPPVPDTVYAVRYVAVQVPQPVEAPATESEAPVAISALHLQQTPSLSVPPSTTFSASDLAPSTPLGTTSALWSAPSAIPVTFRARALASGLSSTEPTPASVRDAVLPNTSFGLLFPISQQHALGVEMGTESFRQQFTGAAEDRLVQYTQTPVLFWMGATYRWTPLEFSFLPGLAPVLDATLGVAVQQGPLARASVGLQYQPVGPLQISVGIDAAALMYRHDGTWFSSTKWGPTIGLGFNLGALR